MGSDMTVSADDVRRLLASRDDDAVLVALEGRMPNLGG